MGALLTGGLHEKEVLHENRTDVTKECSSTGRWANIPRHERISVLFNLHEIDEF